MFGTKFLGLGILLLLPGIIAVGAYFSHATESLPVLAVGTAMSGGGFILLVMGFLSLAGSEFIPKKGVRAGDANLFTIGLIRCMIAISIADNVLEEKEISEISRIYKHLTKSEISDALIRKTAEEMMAEGVDVEYELSTLEGALNKESKHKLIVASLYILAADGHMDEDEVAMLEFIREGLKLSRREVEGIKKNFLAKRALS
ncbi:MAG: TerB family tellurite resistance protein [Alphaproteobacteria bacterium]|nr:TerB family tellurite resistance protein [Alphaproteobacteria bacterium]